MPQVLSAALGNDDSPMFLLHSKAVPVAASVLDMLSKTWDGLPQPVLWPYVVFSCKFLLLIYFLVWLREVRLCALAGQVTPWVVLIGIRTSRALLEVSCWEKGRSSFRGNALCFTSLSAKRRSKFHESLKGAEFLSWIEEGLLQGSCWPLSRQQNKWSGRHPEARDSMDSDRKELHDCGN